MKVMEFPRILSLCVYVMTFHGPTLQKNYYHFFIGKGRSSCASCRGCGERIPKDDLRIKTTLLRESEKMEISFHISKLCVQNAMRNYKFEEITPFSGIVWVDQKYKNEIPTQVNGIKWIQD